ncbi:hypothetical protein [Nocardiopsis metallicus]|uniref:Uncharacterized protein n=1 Tax=Nocardiopsis metallicus TaxID=179819 RepID=A0A840W658_9ACTN|nr:hypothetical protein [Nocardiopsis metallicus]MBB5491494.1 hypothetical protein [Nocardiopsis metallicus]
MTSAAQHTPTATATATSPDPSDDHEDLSLPELKTPRYFHFQGQVAEASWATMARRMPEAVKLCETFYAMGFPSSGAVSSSLVGWGGLMWTTSGRAVGRAQRG